MTTPPWWREKVMVYYITLLLDGFGVRCDHMRFSVLSPFIERSLT